MNQLRIFVVMVTLLVAQFRLTNGNADELNVVIRHNVAGAATPAFDLRFMAAPSTDDLAAQAKLTLLTGERDPNGGELSRLQDGAVPESDDQPSRNFFFRAGGSAGRILVDLNQLSEVAQINTYSWHSGSRGPQVYTLYAASGADGFNPQDTSQPDLVAAGWTRLADVDTRPASGTAGGQYGVSMFARRGALGKFRYLLFDIQPTDKDDPFGHTFFSEIDVIGGPVAPSSAADLVYSFETDEGGYEVTIDTTATPDLTEWANTQLAPVVREWYPKIVNMLPGEGFEAPRAFNIKFNETNDGVAYCSGTEINCSSGWFRRNLQGEGKGSVVHEMVDVVKQYYGRRCSRRNADPRAMRTPIWLQEGIPDFIRWFLYEPQSRGAEINPRNLENARYDANYRISANFINWVVRHHDFDLIQKINHELRSGNYTGDLWKTTTGKTVEELGAEWRTEM
ncbi:MAG: hypothetical protein KDB23_27665, partial [Planctomycetales bacterium]|nr:hypothetical protein [Planctomycetales bacterium]